MAGPSESSSLRKAAILIRSLDTDVAAQLLARLAPREARTLREALRDLGPVDDDDLASVAVALQNPFTVQPTNDLAVELHLNGERHEVGREAKNARSHEARKNAQLADLERLTASPARADLPFQSLIESDAESLAAFLEHEHSQTIAVVFSYLPPNKAAQALAALSEARQAEVIHRLSELGDADPATLEVVERSLESWLAEQRRERQRRLDRISIVGMILAASRDSTRQTICARLRQRNGRLAEQIESQIAARPRDAHPLESGPVSPRAVPLNANCEWETPRRDRTTKSIGDPWPSDSAQTLVPSQVDSLKRTDIEILVRLSDMQLKVLVDHVDPHILHSALASASEDLEHRMCRCLPRKHWRRIQQGIRSLGPISLRDVEAARRIVSEIANRMMESTSSEQFVRTAA